MHDPVRITPHAVEVDYVLYAAVSNCDFCVEPQVKVSLFQTQELPLLPRVLNF